MLSQYLSIQTAAGKINEYTNATGGLDSKLVQKVIGKEVSVFYIE